MKNLCGSLIILLTLFATFSLQAESPDPEWEKQKKELESQWNRMHSNLEKEWDEMEKSQEETWNRLKAEVEQKWQAFVHSTNKDWVAYNKQKDTRSRVDFEKGEIVVEVVIPETESASLDKVKTQLEEQLNAAFGQEDLAGKRVLANQIVTKKGAKVGPGNLKRYLKEDLLPAVKPDPFTFDSRDGVVRRRYSVEIDMVPNHIRIRAEKYLPIVEKNAARFRVEPQLILAIIHTESYFNPQAVSSHNAIGIMQIIPRFAGRDAYQFVYGVDRLIGPEYLYDPQKSIELGSAYLHILKYQHFSDVQGHTKNRYVTVCGYNWGPTSMREKILARHSVNSMTDEQVYALLRQKTPEETREYLKRVVERMSIYNAFFDRG